jgi:hypothetical protein
VQRTASSGSFGSFDGSSVSNKSFESGNPPDAPTEQSAHCAVNNQTVASPEACSTQQYASPPNNHNLVPQKPADLGSQTAATRKPVQHSGAQIEAVVSAHAPVQPMTSTPLDLFDQSTVQQPVTSAAPIDLFAGFNEHLPASHNTDNVSSHSDVAKEPAHSVVQKGMVPSAEALATSHAVHQDLFSLSILQEPATSSSSQPIDLFADFDQHLSHFSTVQKIPSAAPLPANDGWAFLDMQHGSLTSVSNVQGQVPAASPSPPSDGIGKGIGQSTLPTSPPNVIGSQSSPAMMDNWSLNAEEVKIPVPRENSQVILSFDI